MRAHDTAHWAADLLAEQDDRRAITASAYDTALMVVSCHGHAEASDLVEGAVDWLLANQHEDGSWGGAVPERHDRLVCTLAAVVALRVVSDSNPSKVRLTACVAKGVRRLADLIPSFTTSRNEVNDRHESVAFELIFPRLFQRARELRLDLPYVELDWVDRVRDRKLALVPPGVVAGTTLVHTLEALDEKLDESALRAIQSPCGAFGCSPAASAHAYATRQIPGTLDFLRKASAATGSGGVPTIYPFELFEQCWMLHFLMLGGTPPETLRPAVIALSQRQAGAGLAMSAHGIPPDSDDTAVLITLRRYCGLSADTGVMEPFAGDDGYLTYQFERTISVSTNIHVLAALRYGATVSQDRVNRAVGALRRTRLADAYWLDKWHLSPYYPTAEAVVALADVAPDLHRDAEKWLLSTQRDDGSWGSSGGTCEESAYVVLALMNCQAATPTVLRSVAAGMRYLQARLGDEQYPQLWIGKSLYTPFRVVEAAIRSAHLRYQSFWRQHSGP